MKRKSRVINVGSVAIGGDNPVRVQSMTNTDTRDISETVSQIKRLEEAGCELVRVAVLDEEAARAIKKIRQQMLIPLIADIHFDSDLALEAMKNGADGIRINPGNIGGKAKILDVLNMAKDTGKPVRVGVNAGSLEKDILMNEGLSAESLVKSALRQVEILEEADFKDYKVSIKASSVAMTIDAYSLFSEKSDAPLHLGVTEAGTQWMGTIKSAMGIGALLVKGIGDTIRVSLTAKPEEEIKTAWAILQASGVRKRGVEVISCPSCGRAEIDIIELAGKVESAVSKIDQNLTVAVMGCSVNGPGEARSADYGITGGKGVGLIFRKGEIIRKVTEESLLDALIDTIKADMKSEK